MDRDRRKKPPFGEPARTVFDLLAGVALPALCLLLDPVVFRAGALFLARSMFGEWSVPVQILLWVEIAALLAYAVLRPETPGWNALAAGVLWVGVGAAGLVGGVLLSSWGPLAFIPWLTGLAFLRNAVRASRHACMTGFVRGAGVALAVAAAVAALPVGARHIGRTAMRDAIDGLRSGAPNAVDDASASLSRWRWLVEDDDLVQEFQQTDDQAARERFAATYRNLTGRSITDRVEELTRSVD